jgi:hypothetical protein
MREVPRIPWAANNEEPVTAQRKMLSVDLDLTSGTPRIGPQKILFTGPFFPGGNMGRVWDLHPDGQRLLFATAPERERRGRAVEIVLNWDGTLPDRR